MARPARPRATRRDPARSVRGVVRYMQPRVDEPDTFLRAGRPPTGR
ncbi:MAG: hypothetical protein ACRDZ1_11450 [Acidimicrobiia bacterium]